MADKVDYSARCGRCTHTLGFHIAAGCQIAHCPCKAFVPR